MIRVRPMVRPPRCSVVDCTNPHKGLHTTPAAEDIRSRWIEFIYDGNVPAEVGKYLLVCSNHFPSDCFRNLGQYNAGHAERLILNGGSVPSIRRNTDDEASASVHGARLHHMACQTDPPKLCTVGTQLSLKTLAPHYKSIATQMTVTYTNVGVGTSDLAFKPSRPINRPSKRPCLEEEEDIPFEGSSSMDFRERQDSTCGPDDLITVLTESADVKMESSNPAHKTPACIVYEKCLMELFEECPLCRRVADVRTGRFGTFLSIEQQCLPCKFYRKWNSQPRLGRTPIQRSAAVKVTAASFSKLEEVMPTEDIPSSADAFATVTLIDEERAEEITEESEPSDEAESSDESGGNSDSDWNPLDGILLDEGTLLDSEEETEDEDEEETDSPGGLRINELCNECGGFFNSLKTHTCEHKMKPFSCNICGKRCVSEASLKIHSRVHSETYEIPCKYCHVTFKRKVEKVKHEQIHEDRNDPYKCPDCPEQFPTSKERRIHLSNCHRTTKDTCGICGMEFSGLNHLQRHSVVHTGLKPYKCSVCDRGFNQESNLKSHMRLHTGEKPYKCRHCDESFNHNVSLKSHVQRRHSSGHKRKRGKINEKASSASDAEDNESKSGAGSESDNADKQDTGETVQQKSKRRRKLTGRSRGRPKSNPDGNSVPSGQNEDQCSKAKTSKSKLKKLKKSGEIDEEIESEQSNSDISFNSEEELQEARKSTRTSGRRPTKDDDSDFHPEEEKKCKNRGRQRKEVVV
ncbi:zinc finger and SCAN domain-containing protein 12-like [Limanda limanda]|uniref:zinc finger and SCAN domain-containing protein 12-like n=1 Tax=Limanda limanda TaxID=27771 RepID=UPI0029C6F704|nr:zinc finger and SCAN domain-containing protein 12-like [Limanda limanda]